jgi:hypothetical protein
MHNGTTARVSLPVLKVPFLAESNSIGQDNTDESCSTGHVDNIFIGNIIVSACGNYPERVLIT